MTKAIRKDIERGVGRLQCPEKCPKHEVACQRYYPHKPVKLRNPPRILLPVDEHSHPTEGMTFCQWSATEAPHDPHPVTKVYEPEPVAEGQMRL